MDLRPLESIDISDGSTKRRIGVYEGDLSALPSKRHADILVVSARHNHYRPTTSSLIGALDAVGISVDSLAANKMHDLRSTCSFWISHPLAVDYPDLNIGQIACFETSRPQAPEVYVGDLFRGLFPFLDTRRRQTVAMPVLAAGQQDWPLKAMVLSMLTAASHWLARGLPIDELMIVECVPERARELARVASDYKSSLQAVETTPEEVASFDVFLSFSSQDAVAAECAKHALEARQDIKRIFDYRLTIDEGQSWQEEIDRAITSCRGIVALLSPSYFGSAECREELIQARLRNKRSKRPVLFPVYWRDCGGDLDLWLQALNLADCREADQTQLSQTMKNIRLQPL